jgi:hypothetical protein
MFVTTAFDKLNSIQPEWADWAVPAHYQHPLWGDEPGSGTMNTKQIEYYTSNLTNEFYIHTVWPICEFLQQIFVEMTQMQTEVDKLETGIRRYNGDDLSSDG